MITTDYAVSNCNVSCNREDDSSQPPDACRIRGHLYVNKVAGNFHITVGKYVLFTCWKYFRQVGSLVKSQIFANWIISN